jgi:hypothetical protein
VKKRMLLGEVEPRSSTHRVFSELEFSNREISPMPLDRRVSFCGTAGPAVWFEELLKNLITLSETDVMSKQSAHNDQHNDGYTTIRAQSTVQRFAPSVRYFTKTRTPPFRRLSEYRPSLSGTRPLRWQCAAWSHRQLPPPTFATPRDRRRSRFHPACPE